jgi:hypothetical protein
MADVLLVVFEQVSGSGQRHALTLTIDYGVNEVECSGRAEQFQQDGLWVAQIDSGAPHEAVTPFGTWQAVRE